MMSFNGDIVDELSRQHLSMLQNHVDLKVRNFCEGSTIDLRNVKRWEKEFNDNHVLIFTAQKFLNILAHGCFCKKEMKE